MTSKSTSAIRAGTLLGVSICILAALGFIWWLASWTGSGLSTQYGRRRGLDGKAVNGTAVLAKMFSAAGHNIHTWRRLSPRLARSQTIVWTPDSFRLPTSEECDFFEDWLADNPPRTLVFIGRDYDASLQYWRVVSKLATGQDYIEIRRALGRRQAAHADARTTRENDEPCRWFDVEYTNGVRPITLSDGPWSAFHDAERASALASGRLVLPSKEDYRSSVLLGSVETPFVVQLKSRSWPDSQILLILNGSTTLNLPLVNHEHRKIAGHIIEACGPADRVTFLESGDSPLRILEKEPSAFTGMEALTTWPTNAIFLHLILAGVLICLRVFPIFGRPKTIVDDRISDFGQHIHAVGDLLALSNDRDAAMEQITQYRKLNLDVGSSARDSGPGNPFMDSSETSGV